MKILFALFAVGTLLGCGAPEVAKTPPASKVKPSPVTSHENPYPGLRNQALSVRREETGIPAPPDATQPWGVIMETGLEGGTMTLVAFADGTTSIYLSTGGGFIGGGQHETVRTAAQTLVAMAEKFSPDMKKTEAFPQPSAGKSVFYLRTDAGVLTASADDQELAKGHHALSPLFRAAQDVITQFRLVVQSRK